MRKRAGLEVVAASGGRALTLRWAWSRRKTLRAWDGKIRSGCGIEASDPNLVPGRRKTLHVRVSPITGNPQHRGACLQHTPAPKPANGAARPARTGIQGRQWPDGERSAVPTVGGPAIRRQARKRRAGQAPFHPPQPAAERISLCFEPAGARRPCGGCPAARCPLDGGQAGLPRPLPDRRPCGP